MNKYRAKPKVLNGIRFASTVERDRYAYLLLLENAGEIRGLVPHPVVRLTYARIQFTLDALYFEPGSALCVYEDVKGRATAKLERWRILKQLWSCYGVGILREVHRERGEWRIVSEIVSQAS